MSALDRKSKPHEKDSVEASVARAIPKRRRGHRKLRVERFPTSTEWRVELTYFLVPDFAHLDRKVIFPAAASVLGGKGYSHGSGAGFGDRDHDWFVPDRTTAERLARTLKIAATGLLEARLGIPTDLRIPSPRITVTAPPKVVLDIPWPKGAKPAVPNLRARLRTRLKTVRETAKKTKKDT